MEKLLSRGESRRALRTLLTRKQDKNSHGLLDELNFRFFTHTPGDIDKFSVALDGKSTRTNDNEVAFLSFFSCIREYSTNSKIPHASSRVQFACLFARNQQQATSY
jgi:hypothetical protein